MISWCESLVLWRGIFHLISCLYSCFIHYPSFTYYFSSQINLLSNNFAWLLNCESNSHKRETNTWYINAANIISVNHMTSQAASSPSGEFMIQVVIIHNKYYKEKRGSWWWQSLSQYISYDIAKHRLIIPIQISIIRINEIGLVVYVAIIVHQIRCAHSFMHLKL